MTDGLPSLWTVLSLLLVAFVGHMLLMAGLRKAGQLFGYPDDPTLTPTARFLLRLIALKVEVAFMSFLLLILATSFRPEEWPMMLLAFVAFGFFVVAFVLPVNLTVIQLRAGEAGTQSGRG